MPRIEKSLVNQSHLFNNYQTYEQIIQYLDEQWKPTQKKTILALDKALNNISQATPTILITGTNGKSTTIHFMSKLFCQEHISVGTFSSPHYSSYNERFSVNGNTISNDAFTSLANKVIITAKEYNIPATSKDILTSMAYLWFKEQEITVAIIEQETIDEHDPILVCNPRVIGITRLTHETVEEIDTSLHTIMNNVTPTTTVISADQSKITLQKMAALTKTKNGNWIMPIRKVAPLPYPYEQLHGRCASLAERITQTYLELHVYNEQTVTTETLLYSNKKQRGRPTSKTKATIKTQAPKTIQQYWQESNIIIPNRFQIIDTGQPKIILDNASNLDALNNLLLGVRLLDYHKKINHLSFIIGYYENQIDTSQFMKTIRYFFKKSSGTVTFCPVESSIGEQTGTAWNTNKVTTTAQNIKINAQKATNFKTAFDRAKKQMIHPDDLLIITGSQAIISEYWKCVS